MYVCTRVRFYVTKRLVFRCAEEDWMLEFCPRRKARVYRRELVVYEQEAWKSVLGMLKVVLGMLCLCVPFWWAGERA